MTAVSMRMVLEAWRVTIARPEMARVRKLDAATTRYDRVVLVGCMRELCSPTPSFSEVAVHMRTSHGACIELLERWQDMRWQERYGWLKLIDEEARHERTNRASE